MGTGPPFLFPGCPPFYLCGCFWTLLSSFVWWFGAFFLVRSSALLYFSLLGRRGALSLFSFWGGLGHYSPLSVWGLALLCFLFGVLPFCFQDEDRITKHQKIGAQGQRERDRPKERRTTSKQRQITKKGTWKERHTTHQKHETNKKEHTTTTEKD